MGKCVLYMTHILQCHWENLSGALHGHSAGPRDPLPDLVLGSRPEMTKLED